MIKRLLRKFVDILTEFLAFVKLVCARSSENSKKIVVVTHDAYRAGAELLLLNIVKELNRRGWEIAMVTLRTGQLDREFRRVSRYYFACPSHRVFEILQKKRYRSMLVNTIVACKMLPQAASASFKPVVLIHEMPDLIRRNHLEYNAEWLNRYSKWVVLPSRFTRQKFESEIAHFSIPTAIATQGLFQGVGHIPTSEKAKDALFAQYHIDPAKKLLLTVGSGNLRKGIDTFLLICDAFSKDPRLFFVWIGPYDKEIATSETSKERNNYLHIPYINDPTRLYEFYDAADLYLMVSREEPFGTVVMEAFNAATPVMAFQDGGGYVDIVRDRETGFLVPYYDADAMIKRIGDVIFDTETLSRMGTACRQAVDDMSFENYVTRLESIVESEVQGT